jgi:hypothetical protein
MTDWYERTTKALRLNGKGEHTQECYRGIAGRHGLD